MLKRLTSSSGAKFKIIKETQSDYYLYKNNGWFFPQWDYVDSNSNKTVLIGKMNDMSSRETEYYG